MPEQRQPFLRTGEIIPAFTLPGADSMPHSPWDYKQREHLVILLVSSFSGNEASGVLKEFKRQYRRLREEDCAVLAIAADTVVEHTSLQEKLQLPFPLLADPQGEVIARYTYWDSKTHSATPGMALADRYGALYAQWIAEHEAELPPIEELLKDLEYLNKLCTP